MKSQCQGSIVTALRCSAVVIRQIIHIKCPQVVLATYYRNHSAKSSEHNQQNRPEPNDLIGEAISLEVGWGERRRVLLDTDSIKKCPLVK